jgi:UDP-2,3-diacylglucosamine pyrophosphatase LpxH
MKAGSHLVMVLPDLHVPFHDEKALACVLAAYRQLRPQKVVVLGDWLDCEAFSSHGVSSMAELRAYRFLDDEVHPCNRILDQLQRFNNDLVFIEGNHEFRIERWAATMGAKLGPDLYKLVSPRRLLGEGRKKFTWVPYNEPLSHYKITPDLWALHGWSFAKSAARVHQSKAVSVSVVHGHTHRMQMESRRDPSNGRILKAWSPGCLSKLQPLYRMQHPTEWVHGFSLIYVGQKSWTEYTITIENGKCVLPDGKEIHG